MQLYLLRHGIAADGKPGESDAERAITAEGRRKLEHTLGFIAESGVRPDLILSSPLKRALQTAEIAKNLLDCKERILQTNALSPESSVTEVWEEVRAHRDVNALMLVGHNPVFEQLPGFLLGAPDLNVDFKKGAVMRVDFESLSAHPRGVLRWYVTAGLAENCG
ncbi:MAG: phosphohistidine phosphatase SixA [Acidobacteriaceae bacterium]|nr:phosphohistidine phosphatase SixA [Acidobacteriaceae bacterium]